MTPGLIRCGDHFDYGTITLLFQDSMGGLEVKDMGEGWIKAPPIEGCILVGMHVVDKIASELFGYFDTYVLYASSR